MIDPRHRRQGAPEDGRRAGTTTRRMTASPIPSCRSSSATCSSSATNACATTAPTGQSWCGSSTTAPRKTRCRSPPARCRRSRPSRAAAAASARTICGRTCRRRAAGNPTEIVFGTFFNGGLRAFDLDNPYQPKEVAYFVPEVRGRAVRRVPDQRRLHRRPRHRLHRRPPCRRALCAGNGFLMLTQSVPAQAVPCRAASVG